MKQNTKLPLFRSWKLLHILLCYDQDDLAYLEYEIRSYKRAFSKLGKAFKTEKLVFNTVSLDPKRRGNAWKAATRKKIAAKLSEIRADKRELEILKFFNYDKWVLNKYEWGRALNASMLISD